MIKPNILDVTDRAVEISNHINSGKISPTDAPILTWLQEINNDLLELIKWRDFQPKPNDIE